MAQALRAGLRNGGLRRGGFRPGLGNGSLFATAPLDLFFARNRTLDPRITFTRASSGTFVGSDGLIKTASTDVPRFEHNPTTGESLGLLVEESRANLLQRSEELGNVYWIPFNATVTTDSTASPSGSSNADTLVADTTNGEHLLDSSGLAITAGTSYTFTAFVKDAGLGEVALRFTTAANWPGSVSPQIRLIFSTGATSVISGTIASHGATRLSNEWYRVFMTVAAAGSGNSAARVQLTSGGVNIFTGNNVNGVHVWGAQLEAGAFPTSYIPTTAATVTRSADVASITGTAFSSWYRQDEGTVFAETQLARQNTLVGAAICGIETGVTNAEAIYMHYRGSSVTAFTVLDNSVLQADFSPYGSVIPANTLVRQAGAIKLNDMVGIGGGVGQTTDTVCTVPTPDRMLIGFSTAANNYLSGTIRRLTYWPVRLGNTVLQQITQ